MSYVFKKNGVFERYGVAIPKEIEIEDIRIADVIFRICGSTESLNNFFNRLKDYNFKFPLKFKDYKELTEEEEHEKKFTKVVPDDYEEQLKSAKECNTGARGLLISLVEGSIQYVENNYVPEFPEEIFDHRSKCFTKFTCVESDGKESLISLFIGEAMQQILYVKRDGKEEFFLIDVWYKDVIKTGSDN